ncbi:Rid family hydrolase [Pseudomonas putida]|jgi:enamine deaminase RidA (YjgF/YER057c/UK114 family)|uniref:Rid family hydrolase n=1 Tax=Pseudomonas putida TaxID=303 RepID=UPI0023648C6A|nr:Rid family hydrolase [Pseudomonas putida]MDD1964235.1 Rid family hydrolase [Pseudomonas putida]
MTSKTATRQNISSGGQYESVFGYSRAVRVGNHLHISGTCASPDYEHSNAYEQAQAILATVKNVLSEARMSVEDVVRTVVYLRDINDATLVAKAHSEVFDGIRPASSLIQVDSMLRPWQKVEIETYAIVAD